MSCFSQNEHVINDTTLTRMTTSYLDLFLDIDIDGQQQTGSYDKHDDSRFPISQH